jgi:hypothetical protein
MLLGDTYQLYRWYILTVVEHHPMEEEEDGYSLELETGDTIEVSESEIKAPNWLLK